MQFFAIQNNSSFKDFYYTLTTIFVRIKIFILLKYNIIQPHIQNPIFQKERKNHSRINFPCIESIAFLNGE